MLHHDVVCFYHKACKDGTSSAWALYKRFPEANLVPMAYGDEPDLALVKGKDLFILDFSFDFEAMLSLYQHASSLVFIDHHPRSKAIGEKLVAWRAEHKASTPLTIVYAQDKSGCELTWETLHGDRCPDLLRHVGDRDLWTFKLAGTREVTAGLDLWPNDPLAWDNLMRSIGEGYLEELATQGETVVRYRAQLIGTILETAVRRVDFDDFKEIPMVNCPYALMSETVGKLSESAPFAMGYVDTPEGRKYSLRARRDASVDLNVLCAKYGGGGHTSAAGFQVTSDHPLARL